VDFTREPIIETVITPKEGCKLVVRSSKSTGQEEYFVDAVEVVSFGHSFFFRSLERPKTFFVPATDYEILEVRETRMVLKNVGIDRTIKIGGGREGQMRGGSREPHVEKVEPVPVEETESVEAAENKKDASIKSAIADATTVVAVAVMVPEPKKKVLKPEKSLYAWNLQSSVNLKKGSLLLSLSK